MTTQPEINVTLPRYQREYPSSITKLTLGQCSAYLPSRLMRADGTSAKSPETFLFSKKTAVMDFVFWLVSIDAKRLHKVEMF